MPASKKGAPAGAPQTVSPMSGGNKSDRLERPGEVSEADRTFGNIGPVNGGAAPKGPGSNKAIPMGVTEVKG